MKKISNLIKNEKKEAKEDEYEKENQKKEGE